MGRQSLSRHSVKTVEIDDSDGPEAQVTLKGQQLVVGMRLALVIIFIVVGSATAVWSGELADSVRFLGRVSGALRWVSEVGLGRPYVDWILQKVDLLQMYVTAGASLAERLGKIF